MMYRGKARLNARWGLWEFLIISCQVAFWAAVAFLGVVGWLMLFALAGGAL